MTKGTGSPCRISDHPLITLNTSEHPMHTAEAQHTLEGAAGAHGTVVAAGALGGEHGWGVMGGEHVHVGDARKARNFSVWREGGNATRSGGKHEHEPPAGPRAGSSVPADTGASHAGHAGLDARHTQPHAVAVAALAGGGGHEAGALLGGAAAVGGGGGGVELVARVEEHGRVLLEEREKRRSGLEKVRDFKKEPVLFKQNDNVVFKCDVGCKEVPGRVRPLPPN